MTKKNSYPKISIVTPSLNQGIFIEQTIKSVIDQRYPNLEYIIIDGGSTDGSVEIIKKYQEYIQYWVSEKDNGQSDAINKGFSKATGDIFCWLNSDDYLLPNSLAIIGKLNWEKHIGAIVGVGNKVNLKNKIVYTPDYYEDINTKNLFQWNLGKNFMQPASFFSRNAWESCGPLNQELHFCMDVDLWIKISKKYQIKRIKACLAHAYTHELAKTTADIDKMLIETALLITQHGGFKEGKTTLNTLIDLKNKNKIIVNTTYVKNNFKFFDLVGIIFAKITDRLK